jgi:hypothetical protein
VSARVASALLVALCGCGYLPTTSSDAADCDDVAAAQADLDDAAQHVALHCAQLGYTSSECADEHATLRRAAAAIAGARKALDELGGHVVELRAISGVGDGGAH